MVGLPREGTAFTTEIAIPDCPPSHSALGLLGYLEALTFDFERDGRRTSAILIYAEPDPDNLGAYRSVIAADRGLEGVACVDDTARAALLALAVYQKTSDPFALRLALRWLSFVEYMQYPDGSFANFIRNATGVRNASGATSYRGGYWWSSRALRALARAYAVTRDVRYLERYRACHLEPFRDGKINALLALSKLELYRVDPTDDLRREILDHCETILGVTGDSPFLLDQVGSDAVNFWGYHQVHALALASQLGQSQLLTPCRRTVDNLLAPDIQDRMWHSYPDDRKAGVTAYDVAPSVAGLAALYRATGTKRFRDLGLRAAGWFYGRNDARVRMYDPTTGRCRDGITNGVASDNCGAESAIEAGFSELLRLELEAT